MNKTQAAILVLACVASIGIGYFLNIALSYFPSILAADHFEVAKKIWVYDATVQKDLTLKFEGSGSFTPLSLTPLQMFNTGKRYKISRWGYYSGDDLNAYMLLVGPGDDGKTFGAEVVRLAWHELEVTTPRGKYTFPRITQDGVQQGYLSLEFIP